MKLLIPLILIFFWATASFSSAPLKVGVIVDSPFTIKNNNTFSGIAIDLWREIAQGMQQSYTLTALPFKDREKPFEALENGEIDVLIGPLSMTENEYEMADMTLPFFIDKVVAIAPLDYIHNTFFFLEMFLYSIGGIIAVFILLFVFYIHLLWYYEKPHTKNFPQTYKKGISHLFWTHAVSGHHLEIPTSLVGKLLLLLFYRGALYIALIVLNATLISFIAVSLVHYANPIQTLSDLKKKKVGAIPKSRAFKVATNLGMRVIPVPSLEDGIKTLEEGHIGAYLEDFSDADAYLKENPSKDLSISPFELNYDLYVFATPRGSPLLREINTEMFKLRKLDIPQKICKEYFSEGVKNCAL